MINLEAAPVTIKPAQLVIIAGQAVAREDLALHRRRDVPPISAPFCITNDSLGRGRHDARCQGKVRQIPRQRRRSKTDQERNGS